MAMLVAPTVVPGSIAARTQPILALDDAVELRPWAATDAGSVIAAFADIDIQRWHFRRVDSAVEAEAWIAATAEGWRSEAVATWAIAERQGDAVLGRVSLYFKDLRSGIGELSYWVLPGSRGRGLAGRAVIAVTEWAVADVGLHRIELLHSTQNPASCRVAERAGFAAEGVLRSALRHADGWHDMHLHSRVTPTSGE